jgi:hydrogenase assembly chaperone HypC/HupF
MCFILPGKVISLKKNEAKVSYGRKKIKAKANLIKVKKGDYVLVQSGFIIKKIPVNQAKAILKLVNH